MKFKLSLFYFYPWQQLKFPWIFKKWLFQSKIMFQNRMMLITLLKMLKTKNQASKK